MSMAEVQEITGLPEEEIRRIRGLLFEEGRL